MDFSHKAIVSGDFFFLVPGEMRNILLFHCVLLPIFHCVLLSSVWYYAGNMTYVSTVQFPFFYNDVLSNGSAVMCTYSKNFSVNKLRIVLIFFKLIPHDCMCSNIHKWFISLVTPSRKSHIKMQIIHLFSGCYHIYMTLVT